MTELSKYVCVCGFSFEEAFTRARFRPQPGDIRDVVLCPMCDRLLVANQVYGFERMHEDHFPSLCIDLQAFIRLTRETNKELRARLSIIENSGEAGNVETTDE